MKSYTDLEQSCKLAEFLPLESADMFYSRADVALGEMESYANILHREEIGDDTPAWSLAALLGVLPFPQLSKDKTCTGKVGWTVCVCPNDCRYVSCWYNNPIDACYEMILKLKERNLL